MKKEYLELGLITGLGLFLVSISEVSAQQPLSKDALGGNVTEADISIDPAAPLPANGTVTISTEGATDTDMNGFPPAGISVIISSDSVTVTNQPIDVGTAEAGDGGTESGGGSGGETESGNGGSDEGTGSDGGSDGEIESGGEPEDEA